MTARQDLRTRAEDLVARLAARGMRIVTAESCTGGLIAAFVTDVPGSSAVLDRGFVTYSNEAKSEMTGVSPALIAAHGAVSPEVARAMAEGALAASRAELAVAVTGIAGPGGGSDAKPVGLVHFGLASGSGTRHVERRFGSLTREEIRHRSVATAFDLLEEALQAAGSAEARP
ncbi:competence damage-inducible protein A [Aureimonas endophytica]|uniref:Competence damage-inducible protein A n=1 Tax=Aureimonas endophytica TaxID=2027858 RepID=A0A917E1C2_9HYPH|nr:CinA family protein [Aureimonas endophytica]GGD89182.1 competence damage-inducible protein A [Aureimonas endophytica]